MLLFIYFGRFFHIFTDPHLNGKKLCLIFFLKIMAVPVFYIVYRKWYGGIENYDTGKFFHDVQVLRRCSLNDLGFFFRVLSGFQNDTEGSADYSNCLHDTLNWDNGTVKDYLYNDNRTVIRLHLLLSVISPPDYLVHALFNCLMSFCGIYLIYKSFKHLFPGKETVLICVLAFFPTLWFYTGAVLKEGICLFVMGAFLINAKKLSQTEGGKWRYVILAVLFIFSLYLKPYLLIPFELFFGLYFVTANVVRSSPARYYLAGIIALFLTANLISVTVKGRSLASAALEHQKRFEAVSRGGIFMRANGKYLQLSPDTAQIFKTKNGTYGIRKNTSYMFWEPGRPTDTLHVASNKDTLTRYELLYIIPPSGSNIALNKSGPFPLIVSALYYAVAVPLFVNVRNPMQVLASVENVMLILSLTAMFVGMAARKKSALFPLCCLIFGIGISLLAGISAPNSGAIFRYRAPAVIFILLAALYYLPFRTSPPPIQNLRHDVDQQ
jgi:hypothetical protein